MDQRALFKQMVDFNKSAFDNAFKITVLLQKQTEKMNSQLLDQAAWLPEDGKKAVKEWTQAVKKGMDDYKKVIDQGFVNLQKLFPEKKKTAEEETPKSE